MDVTLLTSNDRSVSLPSGERRVREAWTKSAAEEGVAPVPPQNANEGNHQVLMRVRGR